MILFSSESITSRPDHDSRSGVTTMLDRAVGVDPVPQVGKLYSTKCRVLWLQ